MVAEINIYVLSTQFINCYGTLLTDPPSLTMPHLGEEEICPNLPDITIFHLRQVTSTPPT